MLDCIHIQNYKCLLDVKVQLGDFTVLIGPNDSGKTSFLHAIHSLGLTAAQPVGSVFGKDKSLGNLVWHKDKMRSVTWEIVGQVPEGAFTYGLELPAGAGPLKERLSWEGQDFILIAENQAIVVGNPQAPPLEPGMTALYTMVQQSSQPYLAIAKELSTTVEYRFDPDRLCEPSILEPEPTLDPSGKNLASVLEALRNNPDHSVFAALERDLHEAIQSIQGITLPPLYNPPGAKAIEFILSGNGRPPVAIPARLASAGALLLTAFLSLAYDQTPGLLLIEEPENGLHPSRLEMVINLLRRISTGEVGNRKRQVVVTTHSPLLLNYIKPEEVRVFVRHPEQGTKVKPMTEVPDIDKLLKEFATGELWYLLGEEKLFEGQPA